MADTASPVDLSVAISQDGWVEVIGRSAGHEIWRTRLIRQGRHGGTSLQEGATTSFVAVGPRVFRIDNNTGRAIEIGRDMPVPAEPTPVPAVAPPPVASPVPPPQVVVPPPPPLPLAGLSEEECKDLQHCQLLLERVKEATDHVLMATAELENIARKCEVYRGERMAAEAALGAARARLFALRLQAAQELSREREPATAPLTAEQEKAVQEQSRLIADLNLKLNRALNEFADLHAKGAPEDAQNRVLDRVQSIRQELIAAGDRLEQLRRGGSTSQPER